MDLESGFWGVGLWFEVCGLRFGWDGGKKNEGFHLDFIEVE